MKPTQTREEHLKRMRLCQRLLRKKRRIAARAAKAAENKLRKANNRAITAQRKAERMARKAKREALPVKMQKMIQDYQDYLRIGFERGRTFQRSMGDAATPEII